MKARFASYFLFALLLILASCANQVAPTGGEKDRTPPEPDKFIPENYSVNFPKTDIRISFNEYIQLKDVGTQLVVSPPLKYTPETKVRSKTLIIHMDDTLLENTTYTLNFGNAIADITEANSMENFQYVFSTGNQIDSLSISGKVENAFDSKTAKGINVMLYKSTDDSLPYKQLPNYFSKTDSIGQFKINNVSAGEYKIFALKDTNSNYLFDNADESIAFSDSMVQAEESGVLLKSFKEKPKLRLLRAMGEEPGKVVISYNQPVLNPKIEFSSDTSGLGLAAMVFNAKHDSLTIWYRNHLHDSINMIIQQPEQNDTLSIRLRKSDDKVKLRTVPSLTTNVSTSSENPINLNDSLRLSFNHPVEQYDFSKIVFMEDSVTLKNFSVEFKDSLKQKLVINHKWKENAKYILFFPPESFTDIFGLKNDSLIYRYKSKEITDYGTLALGLQLPLEKKNYLLQLIDDKETVYRQVAVNADTVMHFEFLEPKTYRIKLIEDRNNNGVWDTGNYLQHIQPEQVYYYAEDITVRANWDVDVRWKPEIK
jgi:hypothetical protein